MGTKKSLLGRLGDYFVEAMFLPVEEDDDYENRIIGKAEKTRIFLLVVFGTIGGLALYGLLVFFLIKF